MLEARGPPGASAAIEHARVAKLRAPPYWGGVDKQVTACYHTYMAISFGAPGEGRRNSFPSTPRVSSPAAARSTTTRRSSSSARNSAIALSKSIQASANRNASRSGSAGASAAARSQPVAPTSIADLMEAGFTSKILEDQIRLVGSAAIGVDLTQIKLGEPAGAPLAVPAPRPVQPFGAIIPAVLGPAVAAITGIASSATGRAAGSAFVLAAAKSAGNAVGKRVGTSGVNMFGRSLNIGPMGPSGV